MSKNKIDKNWQTRMDAQWDAARESLQGCLWAHPPKESFDDEAPVLAEEGPQGELYL